MPPIWAPQMDADHRMPVEWLRLQFWKDLEAHGLDAAHIAFERWRANRGDFDADRFNDDGKRAV